MRQLRPWVALLLSMSFARAAEIEEDPGAPRQPPLFTQACAFCHGGDARGSERGATLIRPDYFASLTEADIASIISKGRNKMPAFPLPAADLRRLARYIKALNATASTQSVAGDPAAGRKIFFGAGQCFTCHRAEGQGSSLGPDLSTAGRRLRVAEIRLALTDPAAVVTPGYQMVSVRMKDGATLRGFARELGSHDVVVQTDDGVLHPLSDDDYQDVAVEKGSAMPAFQGTAEETRDLVAFVSRLDGVKIGPASHPQPKAAAAEKDAILHPKRGDWPTYNGTVDGNRYSRLDRINRDNVARLQPAWTFPIAFAGLETTPLVMGGIMYVTGNNQVYALNAKTGSEIWRFERPKSDPAMLSSDARIGVNRGVALLGDRVFYETDNAHLLALDRLTGAILWEVVLPRPDTPGRYGGTGAPLVVDDLVIAGVGGADDGIRGFLAAYRAETGEEVWRFWTVPEYGEKSPAGDTWQGEAVRLGGGSTWLTASYDVASGVLYKGIGNPHPDTNGDDRIGANLYTDSDVAFDVKTGRPLWHHQYTPHDIHDWDSNQTLVLVDTVWHGEPHRLLLHANRNGFFYILDRETGKMLLWSQMVNKLTWASGIDDETGQPRLLPGNEVDTKGVKTAPAVRGATNWYSPSFNPQTHLFYVMTVEDYTVFRKSNAGGFGRYVNPGDPAQKILRAFDIETGKPAWQIAMPGVAENNYSGTLSTAGGVLFFGECTGGFAAVDARDGKYLWHFETHAHPFKGSPMTYEVDGRQYVAIAAGANILSFTLPRP